MKKLKLPKNCNYTNYGLAQDYIEKSLLIISFNSTVILEAMLANRNIIIPFFYKEKKSQRYSLKLCAFALGGYFRRRRLTCRIGE